MNWLNITLDQWLSLTLDQWLALTLEGGATGTNVRRTMYYRIGSRGCQ